VKRFLLLALLLAGCRRDHDLVEHVTPAPTPSLADTLPMVPPVPTSAPM
jgi:hypothetical protein